MNNLQVQRSNAAALNAAALIAIAALNWPVYERAYSVDQSVPTHPGPANNYTIAASPKVQSFANQLATIFASISEGQEPLGPEFEAVWDQNLETLYQS